MAGDSIHAPRDRLSAMTLAQHQAVRSLIEELDAVDWYRQRADDCTDSDLRDILLHNMREEIEHACMILEWLRRRDQDWEHTLRTYLFTTEPITAVEEREDQGDAAPANAVSSATPASPGPPSPGPPSSRRPFTVGRIGEDDRASDGGAPWTR